MSALAFEYDSKSTTSQNLLVLDFDDVDEIESGLSRESVKSEITVSKPIPNHFGAKHLNPITFTKALVKSDETAFTTSEISSINAWLTSPTLPKELKVTYDSETIYYNGLFTDIKYKVTVGVVGIIFTFTNDSPFTYRKHAETYTLTQSGNITFNCQTDSINDYCYPLVNIEHPKTSVANPVTTLKNNNITNTTNTFSCKCSGASACNIDNQRKIIKSAGTVISDFSTIGWTADSNIAWIRLINGNNVFAVSSTAYPVKITITTKTPRKIGGLYEY